MTKLFSAFAISSLALSAAGLPVDGNATRQCPSVYFSLAPGFGANFAPEFNLCPGVGPQGNLLIGYTAPYNPAKDIVLTPFAAVTLPGPDPAPQHPFIPAIAPSAPVALHLLSSTPPPPVITPVVVPPGPVSYNPPPCDSSVPEPATLALTGIGLLGVGVWKRRK